MTPLTELLRARRTAKVLGDPSAPAPTRTLDRGRIEAIAEAAALAPFHYPAAKLHRDGAMASALPFRFYALDAVACRALPARLEAAGAPVTKIFEMLAVADALALLTWTPEPEGRIGVDGAPIARDAFAPTQVNMEHLAAAGAAGQAFLLGATEAGWRTYWSTGGALREDFGFALLDLPPAEILLGALFLFPAETPGAEERPGKLRGERGPLRSYFSWRDFDVDA